MQLQNFECQIAKAQIGRYVAGDALSDETVEQLEAHIAKCPDCKQNLAERRATLQAMLSSAEAAPAAETCEQQDQKKRFDLADLIRSKIAQKLPTQPEGKKVFAKPALYSVALGVVLIGMSFVSRNMESMLGPKATNTTDTPKPIVKTATPPTPTQTPKSTADDTPPAKKPEAAKPRSEIKPDPAASKAKIAPPDVEISSTPAPTPKRETKRKRSRSKPARHSEENVIRVYEPEN